MPLAEKSYIKLVGPLGHIYTANRGGVKMPNRALATLFFLIWNALTSSAYADGRDGRWWNHLNESDKLSYVAGFFDGTDYFEIILTGASLRAMADPKTGKFSAERAEAVKAASLGAAETIRKDLSNITAGQLVDGLDQIYRDYRNQGISISWGVYIVIYAINGATEQEVTRLLERHRRPPGQ